MSHKTFVQNTILIGLTQILVSFSGFILLPIITKMLGPEDYGIWSLIVVTVSLFSLFAQLGLSSGTIRFLSSEKNVDIIRDDFYSVLFFIFSTGLLLSLCVFMFPESIAEIIQFDSKSVFLFRQGAWLILLSALSQITTIYFRIFNQIKIFSLLQILHGIGSLSIICFLLQYGYGLGGAIVGTFLAQSIVVIVSLAMIIHQIGFSFPHFTRLKQYLVFSTPLSLNPTLRWISESSDRYFIAYFLSSVSVGIYSAPYAIGNLIQLLVMPIQMALFPEISRLYDEGKINDVKMYFSYSLKVFLFVSIPSFFGLTALSKPIILILTTDQFLEGYSIIPIIALSGLIIGVFQIFINTTLLFKKTYLNFYLFLIPGIVNISLNLILIPLIGIVGAAIATFLSYLVMLIFCLLVTKRIFRFPVDMLSCLKMLIASIFMYFTITFHVPSTTLGLLFSIILGATSYFLYIILLKLFTKGELKFIQSLFK